MSLESFAGKKDQAGHGGESAPPSRPAADAGNPSGGFSIDRFDRKK